MLLIFLFKKCNSDYPGTVLRVGVLVLVYLLFPVSSESEVYGASIEIPAQIGLDVNVAMGKNNEVRQPSVAVKNIDITGVVVNKEKAISL